MNDAEAYKAFLAQIIPTPAVLAKNADIYALFRAQALSDNLELFPPLYSRLSNQDGSTTILYGRRKTGTAKHKVARIEFAEQAGPTEKRKQEIFLTHLIDRLNNTVERPKHNPRFIIKSTLETEGRCEYIIGQKTESDAYRPFAKFACKDTDQLTFRASVNFAAHDLAHTMDGIEARASRPPRPNPTP